MSRAKVGGLIVLCLLVVQVHFLGGAHSEFPSVIDDPYRPARQAAWGIAALAREGDDAAVGD